MEAEVKAEDSAWVEIEPAVAILAESNVDSADEEQSVSTAESIADC